MAHEIKIPSVGESVSEGTLAQWLKSDGEAVTRGENIVVIDTEKASQDLTAEVSGTLRIAVKEGTDVTVGQVIGTIEETAEGTSAPAAASPGSAGVSPAGSAAPSTPGTSAAASPGSAGVSPAGSAAPSNPGTSAATPSNNVGKADTTTHNSEFITQNSSSSNAPITVPAVGESVSEGTIASWSKPDGAMVTKGEDIVVIDTEKASTDLQAEHSGVLRILAQAGTDVKIGQVIGHIETSGAPADHDQKPLHVASPQPQPGTIQPPDQVPAAEAKAAEAQGRPPIEPAPGQQTASPALAAKAKEAEAPATTSAPVVTVVPRREGEQPVTREPMSRMRRTIAAHLLKAKQETAMLTTFNEVDMSAIMALRKKHGEAFLKRHGVKLGFMSFFIKAATDALLRYPLVNASIEGNEIEYHHYVNMAVAVSTERGLAVPVIRDADQLSFAEIESSLIALAQKAKTGRIPLEDLKGGTFTVTNGGVFGSMLSTPLINPPQVAILGMHNITERAVVIAGKIEIRPMMYLALSYDHRLIDGKEAVQFLNHIKDRVAAPEQMLIGL